MQVMKRFEEAEAALTATKSGLKSTWKSVEMVVETEQPKDEPPLLHIHKKGRTYNITFCPRESDEDIGKQKPVFNSDDLNLYKREWTQLNRTLSIIAT